LSFSNISAENTAPCSGQRKARRPWLDQPWLATSQCELHYLKLQIMNPSSVFLPRGSQVTFHTNIKEEVKLRVCIIWSLRI
jgi:hypothetical protein